MKKIKVEPRDPQRENESEYVNLFYENSVFFARLSGFFLGTKCKFNHERNRLSIVLETIVMLIWNTFLLGYTILFSTNFWRSKELNKGTFIRCISFQVFYIMGLFYSVTMSWILPKAFPQFMKDLTIYDEEFHFCAKNVVLSRTVKRMKYFLPVLVLAFTVSLNYVFLNYTNIAQIFYPTSGFSDAWRISTITCIFIVQFINSFQLITNFIFYLTVSYSAVVEFDTMSKAMEEAIKENKDLEDVLEFLYHKHEAMCQVLSSANRCIRLFLLLTFAIHMPSTCVVLYAAINDDDVSAESIGVTCLMIVFSLAVIFSNLLAGGIVSQNASEISNCLWKIKPSSLSEKGLQTLTLFVTKLCGQPFGFTVFGLFTINMQAILMILGTVMAYFVVVIQFKPSGCRADT